MSDGGLVTVDNGLRTIYPLESGEGEALTSGGFSREMAGGVLVETPGCRGELKSSDFVGSIYY